jgi:predicted HNH restriction endonuclease
MLPDFNLIKFENGAPARLRQTYAVIFFLQVGASISIAINKASDCFPQIRDNYPTVASKISTQIGARVHDFQMWYENGTILHELTDRLSLSANDRKIFSELLDDQYMESYQIAEELPDEQVYITEGAKKQIHINAFERSAKARAMCIQRWGSMCVVCEKDLSNTYGDIGRGYIHVHHIVPLSEIAREYALNPTADLRPVCPNCHSIIHSKRPAYTIAEMREIIRANFT